MIKNLDLLHLDPKSDEALRLIIGAQLHQRRSNIQFEVLYVTEDVVSVCAIQGFCMSENYATGDALWDRTIRLFKPVTGDKFLLCTAIPFKDLAEKAAKEN